MKKIMFTVAVLAAMCSCTDEPVMYTNAQAQTQVQAPVAQTATARTTPQRWATTDPIQAEAYRLASELCAYLPLNMEIDACLRASMPERYARAQAGCASLADLLALLKCAATECGDVFGDTLEEDDRWFMLLDTIDASEGLSALWETL